MEFVKRFLGAGGNAPSQRSNRALQSAPRPRPIAVSEGVGSSFDRGSTIGYGPAGMTMHRGRHLKDMPVSQLRRLLVQDFGEHVSSDARRQDLIEQLANATLRAAHGPLAASPPPAVKKLTVPNTAPEASISENPALGESPAPKVEAPRRTISFASPSVKRNRDYEDKGEVVEVASEPPVKRSAGAERRVDSEARGSLPRSV